MANSLSRIEKLENISGEKYPRDFPGRETIKHVLENKPLILTEINTEKYLPPRTMEVPNTSVRKIAGRISARRDHGNNIFLTVFDQSGEIQILAKMHDDLSSRIPPYPYNGYWDAAKNSDIGDMIGVEGTISANKRGEPLLLISNFTLLAKALKDPPANFHGVKNPEHRYRHREQDLLSSAETRELFKTRARIVFEIRKYLNERDFIEIECPILQPIYGGATARPFKTNHNALGQDFFLSISSELYLKRAMVGGFDRVYSFSRCFRNEGISPEHNPEFTNLEIFQTCSTGQDMLSFTYRLLDELFLKYGIKPECLYPILGDRRCCECKNCQSNLGNLYDPHVLLPAEDWPLSRTSADDSDYADAWELFINDMEIASGASDLNDPREQEARLKESELNAKLTSPSNEKPDYDPYDQNYIEALECGALPWAGVGIGIDRLCMLLLGKTNIRDTILFPTLKNEK